MASWRDSTSQQTQDDLDGLLNMALPLAQSMLEKHGEFFPYGVALDAAGDARMIAGDPGGGERPASTAVLEAPVSGLRGERQSLRAAALVSDVRLAASDAVRVELEHSDGAAMVILLPYKQKRLRRGVEYGNIDAAGAEPQIFV